MDRASSRFPARLFSRRSATLCAAGLLLSLGCAQLTPSAALPPAVVRAAGNTDQELPPARAVPGKGAVSAPVHQLPAKALPINLDTVLHLAQDQNAQIGVAREKVNEAFASKDVADKAWLPDLHVGLSYYRHEGGIQNEDGTLTHSSFGALFAGMELHGKLDLREAVYLKVDAERKIWQQKGELSRLTSENLLDASSTYVELLTARAGEAISLEVEQYLDQLLQQSRKLAATDPGVKVEVSRIEAELAGQKQTTRKVREGATSAASRLIYLLGLDPCAELVLMDRQIAPFTLVDANRPTCDLVAQAVTNGPGIRELEGLLNLIHEANERAKGPGRFMPVFEAKMAEGAFGAGPGDDMRWDNRWDLGLQARWNLTELVTARDRQRVNFAKTQQAHLSYQDLRGKLTMGVQEGRESSLSSLEQMRLSEGQILHAREAYKLSQYRLTNNITGRSPSEVLLSIRALGGAQLSYLGAVRDLDKAQLRLLILLGSATENCHK